MAGDLDRLLERGESLCGEHRKVWPECASLHPEMAGDLPDALHADPAVAAPGWRPARPGDTPGQLAPELRDLPEGQQSTALAALVAQVMHKALDDVDEGWHLSCLEPDADEGSGSCFKGHAARRMLEEDVAPKVVDALAARVRADVAEEIARELERIADSEQAPMAYQYRHAMRTAARRARAHAGKGFPSSVESRTPISAPSDVAAPRDALTDQDFTNLNATIKGARGPELFAREGQSACGAPHPLGGPACQRGVGHDTHLRRVSGGSEGWRALPEDEGTRDA